MEATIAVLLDLGGTCDFINDEKASVFINQLDILRKKFSAGLCTISISTHYRDSSEIREVLDILSRNLSKNIKIGISFYYGGIYDYNKRLDIPQEHNFNYNKVSTFDSYYINSSGVNNQWFVIIDDSISDDVYKEYQTNHAMFVCRPSQRGKITNNNFMSFSTETFGFDGVIEGLNTYIDSIKDLSLQQIFETQKNMLCHLSNFELSDKIRKRDYSFIERYFKEGYADELDYRNALKWIIITNSNIMPKKDELIYLQNILEMIYIKFSSINDEESLKKIKKIQRFFNAQ